MPATTNGGRGGNNSSYKKKDGAMMENVSSLMVRSKTLSSLMLHRITVLSFSRIRTKFLVGNSRVPRFYSHRKMGLFNVGFFHVSSCTPCCKVSRYWLCGYSEKFLYLQNISIQGSLVGSCNLQPVHTNKHIVVMSSS